ncbi:MAG: hypothetical protein OXI76_06050 [Gemmatimonadota bacterium]|nr:hypothetical protein [Gemmatimonadota bacterium]
MSGAPSDAGDNAAPPLSSDQEIAARIGAALHDPFRKVWRGYGTDAWLPVLRALRRGIAAHERAAEELAEGLDGEAAEGVEAGPGGTEPEGAESAGAEPGGTEPDGGANGGQPFGPDSVVQAAARYRRRVVAEVLDPLRAAVRDADHAVRLEAELAEIAKRVAGAVEQLPALARAPISASALERRAGMGFWHGVKRECARALRPLVWRREARDVAVADVARRHLGRVVLPGQLRAFRESQRSRARWLGGVERAWSEWLSAVLRSPEGGAAGGEAGGGGDALPGAAHDLNRRLGALAGSDSSPWGDSAGMDAGQAEGILAATVAVAGTFIADASDVDTAPRRAEEAAADWDRWAAESATRLDICAILLEARRGVDGIRRELASNWGAAVSGIEAALTEIETSLARGRARVERLEGSVAGLVEALQREEGRTVDEIGRIEGTLPDPGRLLEALKDGAERALHRFQEVAERLPEEVVVHGVPRADARMRRPGGEGYAVELREAALQGFDALRAQRIRAAPTPVSEAVGQVRSLVAELREVAAYGFEAAIAEIAEAADPAAVQPTVMVASGLSRARNRVKEARAAVFDALAAAETSADREVDQGMDHLIQRATADRFTGRYLDARSQVVAEAARDQERWRGRLSRATRRLSGSWHALRTRLWPVKRALGIGEDLHTRAELRDRSLAFADEVPARLPVVYRRLFAFEPLTDPRLLAGREDAVEAVASARARWQAERTRSLMVIALSGSGVTSFLNIVAERPGGGQSRTVRRTLGERVRTEAALAARLGNWIGLDGAADLDGLADHILAAPADTLPQQVILEGAEHLHLRVPEGAFLLQRLLAFITRTQPRVFWVLSMSASAWQLAAKRCPASLGDIERITLGGLRPAELKQAVLARHRLSGLPLRYVEPRTGRALLRSRGRGAKRQQLIETEYFQKLHRASLGSIRLALFYWLRSADFGTVEGSLQVRPLESLEPFAGPLDIEHSFALKAILDHCTLTVAEYCEVVRVPVSQGRHMFHGLCDLRVIETVPRTEGGQEPPHSPQGSDGSEPRYRVRPLVSGAVVAHLKSLNIVH